jgi:hypothetical protein
LESPCRTFDRPGLVAILFPDLRNPGLEKPTGSQSDVSSGTSSPAAATTSTVATDSSDDDVAPADELEAFLSQIPDEDMDTDSLSQENFVAAFSTLARNRTAAPILKKLQDKLDHLVLSCTFLGRPCNNER